VKRLLQVLFWSVISAAFIGPGTVTTAAAAGASHGLSLLWALVFSTGACLVLQEAAARLTVVSGRDLGEAIRERFRGAWGALVPALGLGAVVLGCAAYEAGNILGGVAGAALGTGLPRLGLTLATGATAFLLLWLGTVTTVSRILGGVVAVMGLAFVATAISLSPSPRALVEGSLVPTIPGDAALLVLGLVGTTVVPYNLFLGSGLARGQQLAELRFGLGVAVVLGGLISMAVVVVGTSVAPPLGFEALAQALSDRLGSWAPALFAFGLLGAGLSSAITAPLAAAVAARSLWGGRSEAWSERAWRYRAVWGGVLLTGVGFGVAEVKPIPAIILAQALNGLLLPFVAVFLLVVINDAALMGRRGVNGAASNAALGVVVAVTVGLGALNLARAGAAGLGVPAPDEAHVLGVALLALVALAFPVARSIRRRRA